MKFGSLSLDHRSPAILVAEISANHQQDLELARKTVRAAAESGADAVKLQTFTADSLTIESDHPCFRIAHGTPWDGRTLYELYQMTAMPWEWQRELQAVAREFGIELFSTPFDPRSADFLEELGVPAFKIASFEITDLPLIAHVAQKGKPVLISTGIAGLEDIEAAVESCRAAGNDEIVLLQCASTYPARFEEMNLRLIPELAKRFSVVAGISDHTPGVSLAGPAVALGAKVVEKHFTLSRSLGGADSEFSLEPEEFSQLVRSVREVEAALGCGAFVLADRVQQNREFARSLFVVKSIAAGETLTTENVRSIRPGFGLAPKFLGEILGRRASRDLAKGTPLDWSAVE